MKKFTQPLCYLLAGLTVSAAADTLYVANGNANTLLKYYLAAGGTETNVTTGNSLVSPAGLAFDPSGNLFVVNQGVGNIIKIAPNGGDSIFASNLDFPQGLACDSRGNLYAANYGSNNIIKYQPDGTASIYCAVPHPTGLAFDKADNLYAANYDAGGIDKIANHGDVATNGDVAVFVSANLGYPTGLAFDSAGHLYVADHKSNSIAMFTTNAAFSIFASNDLSAPWGIAFDSQGNLYVSNDGNEHNEILKFAPNGSDSIFASGLSNPVGIAIQPDSTFSVNIKLFAGIVIQNGQIGSNYLIQATSTLNGSNWTTLTNVTLPSNPFFYIDYSSYTNSQQFYRAVPQ